MLAAHQHQTRAGLLLLVLIWFTGSNTYSQQRHVAPEIGFGTFSTSRTTPSSSGFPGTRAIFFKAGVHFYRTPVKAIFNLTGGVSYDIRSTGDHTFHYLRAPFGMDFFIGKRFRFVLGYGLACSCLFNAGALPISANPVQLLCHANGGFEYQFKNNDALGIRARINRDLVPAFYDTSLSQGGQPYDEPVRSADIHVSVYVKFNRPLVN